MTFEEEMVIRREQIRILQLTSARFRRALLLNLVALSAVGLHMLIKRYSMTGGSISVCISLSLVVIGVVDTIAASIYRYRMTKKLPCLPDRRHNA